MKTSLGIIFLFLYAVALIRPVVPVVEYYVQLEEYKIKCENRTRPSLHCDGQCILMKKIKAANPDLQEPAAPAPVKLNVEDFPLALISTERQVETPFIPAENNKHVGIALALFHSAFIGDIFHPPLG